MLHLASATAPEWVTRALTHLDEVLVDHAHCEKKAASTAVSLLFRYPERADLTVALSRLAREELAHFERVTALLVARGVTPGHQRPAGYAAALLTAVRTTEPERLVDTLLCMALIEARSCERMQLVADACPDPAVVTLYRDLLASEARHHATYVELAANVMLPAVVETRLRDLAVHEAVVLASVLASPRLHA